MPKKASNEPDELQRVELSGNINLTGHQKPPGSFSVIEIEIKIFY